MAATAPVRAVGGRARRRGDSTAAGPANAARAAPARHHRHRGSGRPRPGRGAARLERGRAPSRGGSPAGRGRARARGHPRGARALERAARRVPPAAAPGRARWTCSSASSRRRRSTGTSTACAALLGGAPPTLILCDNEGQLERLEELLEEGAPGAAPAPRSPSARSTAGSSMPALRVLTDHEIFRRARRLRRAAALPPGGAVGGHGRAQSKATTSSISSTASASTAASTRSPSGESTLEVAVVEYEGGDRLNVPLYRLDQLERYRAAGEDGDRPPPRLHRLGGSSLAAGAREDPGGDPADGGRAARPLRAAHGDAAATPSRRTRAWQRELESSFLYEDTPDQRKATEEVKADMEQPAPDGPPARGRRRLRQDRDRGARRVQGGAGRQAGGGARADDDSRRAARADLRRAPGRLPGARSRCCRASGRPKEQKAALERLAAGADRHRHRHPPAALEGRRCSRTSACSSWTRSTGSA